MLRLKNKRGFSLVEVLSAMVVLAIGILGLAPLIVLSIRTNSYSQDVTDASVFAQDRIEQLKSQASFTPMPYTETTNPGGGLTRTVRIDNNATDGTCPAGMYRIAVTITWTEQNNVTRRVVFNTYKPVS